MFVWSSQSRLQPYRMVWSEAGRNYNSPEYEIRKLSRPDLRRWNTPLRAEPRVGDDMRPSATGHLFGARRKRAR